MPLGTRELLILIRARDEASGVIRALGANFSNLDSVSRGFATKYMQMGAALMGAGTAIAGAGGLALNWMNDATNVAADYNKAAALTKTQVDSTKISLDQIKKAGLEVATTLPVAFDDVQKSFFDIFSSIDVNLPQAKKLLTGFGRAAVAGNTDIQTAGKATIAILNAYHLPVSSLQHVLDLQFQLVRKGVGTYEQFAETIGRAIPSSVRAGQSFSTLAGMMAFLTRNGLSAAMASASAGRALDAMSHPKVVHNLEEMGVKVKDARGEFLPLVQVLGQMNEKFKGLSRPELSAKLFELFKGAGGTIQARRFFDSVFKNFDEFKQRVGEMSKSGGAAMQAFGQMVDEPANKVQLMKNRMRALKQTVGDELLPVKMKLYEVLSQILGAWNKLSPSVQGLIIKIIALTAVIMVIVGIVMAVVGAFFLLEGALALVGVGIGTFALICAGVVVAIVAIVAVVILVIKYHKQLAAAAVAAWNWIKDAAKKAWEYIQPVLEAIGRFFTQTLPNAFSIFVTAVVAAWNTVSNAIVTAWNWVYNSVLQPFAEWFGNNVMPVLQAFSELIGAVAQRVVQWFQLWIDGMQQIWTAIQIWWGILQPILIGGFKMWVAYIKISWNTVVQIFRVAMAIVKAALSVWISVIQILWRNYGHLLVEVIKTAWALIRGAVESALRIIKGIIQVVTGLIKGDWSKVWEGIKNIVGGAWQWIWTMVKASVHLMWESIKAVLKTLYEAFTKLPGKILEKLGDLTGTLVSAGEDLIKGLIKGIGNMAGAAVDAVKNVGKGIVKGFGKLIGRGSPAKVFIAMAEDMGEGLIIGMKKMQPKVDKALLNMSGTNRGLYKVPSPLPAAQYTPLNAGRGPSTITIQPGAVQLTVQGNIDSASLPHVKKMLDDTVTELAKMLEQS